MPSGSTITSIGVGVCIGHPPSPPIPMVGTIVTGSPSVFNSGNLPVGFTTSIVLGACGHIGIIVTGSSTVIANSLNKSYIGSVFVGVFSGIIVTGFSGVQVGG